MKNNTFNFLKLAIVFLLFGQVSNTQNENIRIDLEEFYQKDPASPNTAPVLVNISYSDYFYDNGGTQFTSRVTYSRPIGETEWMESLQILRTYDGENKLITHELQIPDGMGGFIPSLKQDFVYDENDNLEITYQSTHNTVNWVNYSRVTATYNPDNTQADARTDLWNVGTNSYDYSSLSTYTYENGNNTLINNYTYSGMTPVIDYRIIMTYTEFDVINDRKVETWDGDSWENGAYTVYSSFDMFLLESIQYFWDTSLTPPAYVNNGKTIYHDSEFDGFAEQITFQAWDRDEANGGANPFWYDAQRFNYGYTTLSNEQHTMDKGSVYPNPFTSQITISLPTSMKSDGRLVIFDSLGKEISNSDLKQGTKSISLNNPHLAEGLYFIHIASGNEKSIFKVIKE